MWPNPQFRAGLVIFTGEILHGKLHFLWNGSSFFDITFFNIETRLKQRISQNTEERLLYCTHCHTNVWSHLISLVYYNQLRFYFAKFLHTLTAQRMKFSIKYFFSKCDQIRRKLRILSLLLKKSLMENFIFCIVVGGRSSRICKLSCRLKWWRWRYIWTRNKFFWCF